VVRVGEGPGDRRRDVLARLPLDDQPSLGDERASRLVGSGPLSRPGRDAAGGRSSPRRGRGPTPPGANHRRRADPLPRLSKAPTETRSRYLAPRSMQSPPSPATTRSASVYAPIPALSTSKPSNPRGPGTRVSGPHVVERQETGNQADRRLAMTGTSTMSCATSSTNGPAMETGGGTVLALTPLSRRKTRMASQAVRLLPSISA
jgi:hypothetical protein